MATLYLIRHGQAGFGQEEYDVLSTLGASQAQALGRHLIAAQRRIDLLYCAPRRRHRDTVVSLRSGMADGMADAAIAVADRPDTLDVTHIIPDFDEFPFAEILLTACGSDGILGAEYAALWTELQGRNPLHDAHGFGRLFRMAMPLWIAGDIEVSESFAAFSARVEHGLRAVAAATLALGSGRSAAVVTSAGAIAAVLQRVLGISPDTMLRLCLALYNTGVTELRVRGDEISLIAMNSVPHLLSPTERTFR